jgi:integrase
MKHETEIRIKEGSVCLYYRRIFFYIGMTLQNPDEWNSRSNNFSKKRPNFESENLALQNVKDHYDKLISDATKIGIRDGKDFKEYIKNQLIKKNSDIKKENNLLIVNAYHEFWNKLKRSAPKFSIRTESKYKTHETVISDFCTHTDIFNLNQINLEWATDFRMWLAKEQKRVIILNGKEKKIPVLGLRNKTLKKYMSNLFTFLHYCEDTYGLNFDKQIFKIKTADEKHTQKQNAGLALTPEMYNELKSYKPASIYPQQNVAEELTRDFIIFLCNTGLRWSDFEKLTKSDVKIEGENVYINTLMKKTDDWIGLKLNNTAKEIFIKYNYDFKKLAKSNQNTNETIKNILQKLPSCQGKKKITKQWLHKEETIERPFYELFTIHKTRHTFVSRLIKAGANPASIQKATGWSKLEMINVYLDLESASDDNVLELLDK